jgi:hypothetical protein
MTGSSRKEGSTVMPGTSAETEPAVNEVTVPSAMSEFMLGAPRAREPAPSTSSWRPGPRSAAAPRAALTLGSPRTAMKPVCAYSWRPRPWRKWPRWWP